MDQLFMLLGVALIVVLVYLALSGQAIPPALKVVVLVAVALMFLICVLRMSGCEIPKPIQTTQHLEVIADGLPQL